MYSKQQIIDTLNSEDIFIDNFLLEAFIKNWKIEPIYEDAQGVEFFDDMAIEKIRNGILQKQPKCEINIIDKNDIGVYYFNTDVEQQRKILAQYYEDGFAYILGFRLPVFMSGSFVIIGAEKHPKKKEIIKAFRLFK